MDERKFIFSIRLIVGENEECIVIVKRYLNRMNKLKCLPVNSESL